MTGESNEGREGKEKCFFVAVCLLFLKNTLEILYSVSVQVFAMREYMWYEHAYEQISEEERILNFTIEIVIYQLLDFGFPF